MRCMALTSPSLVYEETMPVSRGPTAAPSAPCGEGGRGRGRDGNKMLKNTLRSFWCTSMEDTHPLQLTEVLMHLPRDPVPLMIPATVAVALALSFSDL